jgi:hypothetical protein
MKRDVDATGPGSNHVDSLRIQHLSFLGAGAAPGTRTSPPVEIQPRGPSPVVFAELRKALSDQVGGANQEART